MPIPSKIWIDQAELDALPTTGQAWDEIVEWADGEWPASVYATTDESGSVVIDANHLQTPCCGYETTYSDNRVIAMAIAHCKTPDARPTSTYLAEVEHGIREVIGSEIVNPQAYFEVYNVGRNLGGFIIAADMVDLKTVNPVLHARFSSWLRYIRDALMFERQWGDETFDRSRSITSMVIERPNNHGTSGEQMLMALNMYLRDEAEVAKSVERWRILVGDLTPAENPYKYKMLGNGTWQADPDNPVMINRLGATITQDGVAYSVDGCPPEEARRTGTFHWPFGGGPYSNYFYSMLAPLTGWVHMMERCGYPALEYGDHAFERLVTWLYDNLWIANDGSTGEEDLTAQEPGTGYRYFPGSSQVYGLQDDIDTIYLINRLLNTSYPTVYDSTENYGKPGKSMGHNYYVFGGGA